MSDLVKRSFTLSRHRTSIALEPEFWAVLEAMCAGHSLASVVAGIDAGRPPERPLASALRVAVLTYLLDRHAPDDRTHTDRLSS